MDIKISSGDRNQGILIFPEPDAAGQAAFKSCHASTVLPLSVAFHEIALAEYP